MLRSQNQFNLLIKNIRSGVALIDDTGKFTVVNPSFLRMFGLKDDETINNVNDKNWNDWQVFESDGTLLHVDEHPVRKVFLTGKAVRDKLVGVRLRLAEISFGCLLVRIQCLDQMELSNQ